MSWKTVIIVLLSLLGLVVVVWLIYYLFFRKKEKVGEGRIVGSSQASRTDASTVPFLGTWKAPDTTDPSQPILYDYFVNCGQQSMLSGTTSETDLPFELPVPTGDEATNCALTVIPRTETEVGIADTVFFPNGIGPILYLISPSLVQGNGIANWVMGLAIKATNATFDSLTPAPTVTVTDSHGDPVDVDLAEGPLLNGALVMGNLHIPPDTFTIGETYTLRITAVNKAGLPGPPYITTFGVPVVFPTGP